jgi:hypothetical protein
VVLGFVADISGMYCTSTFRAKMLENQQHIPFLQDAKTPKRGSTLLQDMFADFVITTMN